jgi:hypothetical protein
MSEEPIDSPEPQFKIVSTGGTTETTKVYYGDVEVQGITNLNINLDATEGAVHANFTVLMPLLNIVVPKENLLIIPLNTCDATVCCVDS